MNGALYFKLNNAELLIHKLKTNPEFEDLYPNDLNLVQSCRGPEDFNLKRKFNKMRSLLADSNKKLDKVIFFFNHGNQYFFPEPIFPHL